MSDKPLRHELEYFIAHQDELVRRYAGKFVAIKGDCVLGAFDTALEAVRRLSRNHEPGTFMVQKCEPGPECYTAVFHGSLVSFPD